MVAAGSSLPVVQGDSVRTARLLEEVWGGPVRAALVTGPGPRMSEVVADLRAASGAPPAVATYLVAPGPVHTRAREDAHALALDVVADPMGDHPRVAEAVVRRYRSATAHRFALSLS
jgi:sirohydrochlorin ferrochelatase